MQSPLTRKLQLLLLMNAKEACAGDREEVILSNSTRKSVKTEITKAESWVRLEGKASADQSQQGSRHTQT